MQPLDPPNPLAVDLDDPEDIRAKIPLIEDRLREKQERLDGLAAALRQAQEGLDQARSERDHWAALLAGFRGMVPAVETHEAESVNEGAGDSETTGMRVQPSRATSVEVVVSIINRHRTEMTTSEVRQAAAPHGLADDTVSWALWRAAKDGVIRRIKKGRYAPLTAVPEQSELAVSSNGTTPDETSEPAPDAGVHTQ